VAADGGRSPLRAMLELKLEGASYEGYFVIADIRVDLPLPTERLAFFDPDWNPGNTVLMHREPHGIWRVDYQLPAGETPEQALQEASLRARIDATLSMIGHGGAAWEMDWASVYSRARSRCPTTAAAACSSRGDAAHLLPIFGVRGANTAFQDAQPLGWHLALSPSGLAGEALLANYSAERVRAAREIIDEAGKSTRFMTPPTPGFQLLRDAVLSLSLRHDFVRPLYHWRTSRPHEYTHSMLNATGDDDALHRGTRRAAHPAQHPAWAPDDHLLDHLGGGFELLYSSCGAGRTQAAFEQWSTSCACAASAVRVQRRSAPRSAVTGADRGLRRCARPPARALRPAGHRCGLPAASGPARVRALAHARCNTSARRLRHCPAPLNEGLP
jgi:3-(3-hydroxy-phenyl)propionate hydroxylase